MVSANVPSTYSSGAVASASRDASGKVRSMACTTVGSKSQAGSGIGWSTAEEGAFGAPLVAVVCRHGPVPVG